MTQREKLKINLSLHMLTVAIGMFLVTYQMRYFCLIKSEEGEYLKFYSFIELNKEQFNQSVKLIRDYIAKQENPTEWQKMAQMVWTEIAEPYIVQDERYQQS